MPLTCEETGEVTVRVVNEDGSCQEIDFGVASKDLGKNLREFLSNNEVSDEQIGDAIISMVDEAVHQYKTVSLGDSEIPMSEPETPNNAFASVVKKYPKTSFLLAAILGGGGALLVKSSYKKFK